MRRLTLLALCACGLGGGSGGGSDNLPVSGVGPYRKLFDADFSTPVEEPFVVSELGFDVSDPSPVARDGGVIRVFFTRGGNEIWRSDIASLKTLAEPAVVSLAPAEAWEAGARPAAPARVFGFWRAVVAAPGAKKKQLVDDASLLDLFEQLAGATEGRKVAFRYLLALVLVRKRLLVIEGAKGGTMLVRHKGAALPPERGGVGPPLLEVIDPGLDPQALEEGTEELAAILLSDAAPGAGR